jgi:hypothetical protein
MFYHAVPSIWAGQRYAAVHCIMQEQYLLIRIPRHIPASRIKSFALREAKRRFAKR